MPHQRGHAPKREGQSDSAAQESEDGAFGEELLSETFAAGAERGPERHFLLARGGAGEQEISDVGAGDEEHHDDRGEQREKRSANVGDGVLFEGDCDDAFVLVVVGVEAPEIAGDAVEFGSRLCEGHSGLEACEGVQGMSAALPGCRRRRQAQVGPHVESRARLKIGGFADEGEVAGEDADHGVLRIVQADVGADDCGARAEVPLPGGIAEHHDVIFGGLKAAAERHTDAEEREEIGGDGGAVQSARLACAGEDEVGVGIERGHLVEGGALRAPVVEVRGGDGEELAKGGMSFPEGEEAAGMGVGKRLEEDAVDDSEDGGIGADAEGEREDGDGGEGRILAQAADGVAHVLHEDFEGGTDADVADILFDLFHTAEIAAGFLERAFSGHAAADVFGGGLFQVGG